MGGGGGADDNGVLGVLNRGVGVGGGGVVDNINSGVPWVQWSPGCGDVCGYGEGGGWGC